MNNFFDSCTHPTLTGNWGFNKNIKNKATFNKLISEIKKNKINKACAIGFDNFEEYNHIKFINECKKYKDLLIPIAGLNPNKEKKYLIKEIKLIKKLGYMGIKLHPRISNFYLDHKNLNYILKVIEDFDLVLMLCCYITPGFNKYANKDFLLLLIKLFKNNNKLKTILMHGGCYRILEFSEFIRLNPENFLLDLSMTMMRYKGSSIELDIKFLFENLDERICIGSDFPEYSIQETKKRFIELSKNLSEKKRNNISYNNLNNFFKN